MSEPRSQTIAALYDEAMERHGGRPLIVSDVDDSVFSYREADTVVTAIAARLAAHGLERGARVASYAAFHTESLLVFLAAMRRGLVFVPIDHQTPGPALARILDLTTPSILFADRERLAELPSGVQHAVQLDDETDAPPLPGAELFSDWLGDGPEHAPPVSVAEDDTAVVLFTSGTTGDPKGVSLSHGALYRSGALVRDTFGWHADDLLWSLGELHAMSGLRNPAVVPLHTGCAVLVTRAESRASVFAIAECLERRRPTLLSTTPTLIRQLVEQHRRIGADALVGLRQVICTGSELRPDTVAAFGELFALPVLNYYGLTETAGICLAVPATGERIPAGSVGVPVGCRAAIFDRKGHELPRGEVGELRIASPNLLQEYWPAPTDTPSPIHDGWFHTGDLARQDDAGAVTLVGRATDIIKDAHGALLHPAEVEAALEGHPAVAEAGACGYLSPHGDERLAAFVVPRKPQPDAEALFAELAAYLTEQLGPHKLPGAFRLAQTLPRDDLGSLLRRELAAWLNEEQAG